MSEKKYELLTNDTITIDGRTLYRIRALTPLRSGLIQAGQLGGYLETEANLAQRRGDAWVDQDACVYGNGRVFENVFVRGNARIYGHARVLGYTVVTDAARIHGSAHVRDAQVYGNASISGEAVVRGVIAGNAYVSGNAEIQSEAYLSGDALITKTHHHIVIGPVGSENRMVTIHRNTAGYQINAGCWSGTAEELEERIQRDTCWAEWEFLATDSDDLRERWRTQYQTIIAIVRTLPWAQSNDEGTKEVVA